MNNPAPTSSPDRNPLLQAWDLPHGLPPFRQVRPEHFAPAFAMAMQAHRAELDAIASQPQPATFDNTIAALDGSGRLLNRIELMFSNLTVSETSPALQAVERDMAARLAAHENALYMHEGLFARIDDLFDRRQSLGLDDESTRLLERIHLDFVLAGAKLAPDARLRYAQITEELANLTTRFTQNLLADESGFLLPLREDADLAGLPESVRSAARAAAEQRGLGPNASAVTLSPSLAEPFLTFSARRDLREAERGPSGHQRDRGVLPTGSGDHCDPPGGVLDLRPGAADPLRGGRVQPPLHAQWSSGLPAARRHPPPGAQPRR